MSTLRLPSKTFHAVHFMFVLLVLTVQGFPQTPTRVKASGSLRDELTHIPAETGMSVAIFDHGKLTTAPMGSPKNDWNGVEISGAIGHSWSHEGMLSPDGTLAAFPYWEVDPCPPWKNCDVEADRHYFLAVAHTDGSGVRKYPQIVLPSEMCWTRDNSKLAMVAHMENDPQSQLVVLDLVSGKADLFADGKKVAVTPQCWSPDGKNLVYFASEKDLAYSPGEKKYDRPGTIRVLDIATREYRDILHGNSKCPNFCVSPFPTWSPDGEWIAYYQEKTYWAVHPSGEGRKELFRRGNALSPLQWSPDGRYALYADCCAFRDTWRCMCEIGRIRVRRLADNADVEISGDGYQNMYVPRWTWIQKKRAN
jgi:WD40-like Beta Propeller Repeat